MSRYRTQVVASVRADLRKLGKQISKPVGDAIRRLETEPRPSGCETVKGRPIPDRTCYRIHVDIPGAAAYRVIYTIEDDALVVLVLDALPKNAHTYQLPYLRRRLQSMLQDFDEGL